MRYAVLDGTEIVNVVEGEPPGVTTVADPSGLARIGGTYSGGQFHAPAPVVPEKVSDLQFRLALSQAGLRTAAEAFIADAPQDMRDYWDRSLVIHRNHPMILAATVALNKTEQDLDAVFILAGSL
jgi:hypothetical protein